jgi:UDP-N-acetylmuramate dehydrogenase
VTHARFRTEPGDVATGRATISSIVRWRKEHQPPAVYNAGSVFRNPPGDSAGRIIDSLGLKGLSVGGVRVSDKHANFFVAASDASATDVYRLVQRIRDTVEERTGIELHPEIQFVGDFG